MPISVRNTTGAALELWDVGNQLANLANNQSIINLPITITSVTRANVGYHRKVGGFLNNSNYIATFANGTVIFNGSLGPADIVRFS